MTNCFYPSNYTLPFVDNPLLTYHHDLAFFMGIVQSNANALNKDFYPWLVCKYINTSFDKTDKYVSYDLSLFDKWGISDGVLLNQNISLNNDTIRILEIDILKWLISLIKSGWYVNGLYNEKYIPGKFMYQKSDFLHDFLFYGVNEEKGLFYSAGYLSDSRFRFFEISFDDFVKSINNSLIDKVTIDFWSFNEQFEFAFNKNRLITELNDYLKATSSHNYKPDLFYGFEANAKLKDYLISCATQNNKQIDFVYSRAYMEHEHILYLCLKFISDRQIIDLPDSAINEMEEIYKNAVVFHRLIIKYNITKNSKLISSISTIFDCNQEKERILLNSLLERFS